MLSQLLLSSRSHADREQLPGVRTIRLDDDRVLDVRVAERVVKTPEGLLVGDDESNGVSAWRQIPR